MQIEKRFIIKNVFNECVYSRNEYNTYSMRYIINLIDQDVKMFLTEDDAEKEIIDNKLTQVTIVKIYITT